MQVPLIRLLIPSRLTNTLSTSSLPVKSSAITYRLGLTPLAASNMALKRKYNSITDRNNTRMFTSPASVFSQVNVRLISTLKCIFWDKKRKKCIHHCVMELSREVEDFPPRTYVSSHLAKSATSPWDFSVGLRGCKRPQHIVYIISMWP